MFLSGSRSNVVSAGMTFSGFIRQMRLDHRLIPSRRLFDTCRRRRELLGILIRVLQRSLRSADRSSTNPRLDQDCRNRTIAP